MSILRLFLIPVIMAVLPACGTKQVQDKFSQETQIYVIGAIHGEHRTSKQYSLKILEKAIRRANPDLILAEIPPDRFPAAWQEFQQNGYVSENRVRAFPEYTDVVFPLSKELEIELVPVAAWNQEIADNRSKVLKKIANDPTRKDQWAAYQAAQNAYAKMVAGRGDDPLFIHSKEYDRNVEKAQQPYVHFFEKDIGAGGWQSINDAHLALINQALDRVSGQKQVIVIIFGSWHKCKIINGLSKRNDVILRDSKTLFR